MGHDGLLEVVIAEPFAPDLGKKMRSAAETAGKRTYAAGIKAARRGISCSCMV